MIAAADASVLVAELVRVRGWEFVRDPRLRLIVAEEQWGESQHEINRRLRHRVDRGWLADDQLLLIHRSIQVLIADESLEVVSRQSYDHLEATARRRVPRDPNDWPTVALAIAFGADILTNDNDFLGCGCATWTIEILRSELEAGNGLRS